MDVAKKLETLLRSAQEYRIRGNTAFNTCPLLEKILASNPCLEVALRNGASPILLGKRLENLYNGNECDETIELLFGISWEVFPMEPQDICKDRQECEPARCKTQLNPNVTLEWHCHYDNLDNSCFPSVPEIWRFFRPYFHSYHTYVVYYENDILKRHTCYTMSGDPSEVYLLINNGTFWMLKDHDLRRWRAADSWKALLDLNKEFLRRSAADEHVTTPYIDGPLHPNTRELVPSLLRLHSYGILTTKVEVAQTDVTQSNDFWYQFEQVPYLEFIVPFQEKAEEFLQELVADQELECIIRDGSNDRVFPGSENEITFIREKRYSSREGLEQHDWEWFIWRNTATLDESIKDFLPRTAFSQPVAYGGVTASSLDLLLERVESYAKSYKQAFLTCDE